MTQPKPPQLTAENAADSKTQALWMFIIIGCPIHQRYLIDC